MKHRILLSALALLYSSLTFTQYVQGQPLVDAVAKNQRTLALQLISSGSDANETQPDNTSALIYAAHQNDIELTQALLSAGANASHVNNYGTSAISEATIMGGTEIITLLLHAGVNPNWANGGGETVLMNVARAGNLSAARLLLEFGANVNSIESWGGQSALMWATAQSQPAMMLLLIEHGADVNTKSSARLWKRRITSEPRLKDMNKGGFSSLHYAARQGCIKCIEILATAGADLNSIDPDRVSPLNLAIINLHFDAAATLIEAGAKVNQWDLFGRAPLYNSIDLHTLPVGGRPDIPSADTNSGYDIAVMLLKKGANPNMQLKLLAPYRDAIFDRGSDKVLFTGATPLMRAAKAADIDSVKLLLSYGALPNLPNAKGQTPLMVVSGIAHTSAPTRGRYRTETASIKTIELLLEAGASINILSGNPSIRPEMKIIDADRGKLMHPANQGEIVIDGQTALHGAAKQGWTSIAKYLIEHGAKQQVKDAIGNTPLDLAMGRYEPAYNDSPPQPFIDTAEFLREQCYRNDSCVLLEEAPLD